MRSLGKIKGLRPEAQFSLFAEEEPAEGPEKELPQSLRKTRTWYPPELQEEHFQKEGGVGLS